MLRLISEDHTPNKNKAIDAPVKSWPKFQKLNTRKQSWKQLERNGVLPIGRYDLSGNSFLSRSMWGLGKAAYYL